MSAHDQFDRGSKWLLQHHGDAILRLGGVTGVSSWKSVAAELVQPKQLPDGLLEVCLAADPDDSTPYLVEIATYPEERLAEQVVRDAMLVYLDRHVVPDVLTLILRPRGNVQIIGNRVLSSLGKMARIEISWKVIEIWNLSAEQLFAANDVGLVPWIPLTQFEGPPEAMLSECRRRIDEQAPADEQENLLVVTQVLAGLRYNSLDLLKSLGGRQLMIESPLIQEIVEEAVTNKQRDTLRLILANQFGNVPPEVLRSLNTISTEAELDALSAAALASTSIDEFRTHLPS